MPTEAFLASHVSIFRQVLAERPEAASLTPVCRGPLTDRLSTLSATGLFWMLNLMLGDVGHALSGRLTGANVPPGSTSIRSLSNLSGNVHGGKASGAMLNYAWSRVFEPLEKPCGPAGERASVLHPRITFPDSQAQLPAACLHLSTHALQHAHARADPPHLVWAHRHAGVWRYSAQFAISLPGWCEWYILHLVA